MSKKADGIKNFLDRCRQLGIFAERSVDRIFLLLCFIIFSGLTFYSIRYTEMVDDVEIPYTIIDSTGGNLLTLLAVAAVVLFLGKSVATRFLTGGVDVNRRIGILTGAVTICVTIISIGWVSVCQIGPRADGRLLCVIAEGMMAGNFQYMLQEGYMYDYPHQYSFLMVLQILFYLFGAGNYQAFQYFNALCMPLLFYSGYKIIRLICNRAEVVIYYILLFVGFIPMFLYVPYVYGDISSVAFSMLFMWQIIRYCKTGRKSCYLWGALGITSACVMRRNSMIVLVAAAIVLIIFAFRQIKLQALVWIFALFFMVFATDYSIKAYYEKISGNEISEGIPYISWVLIGLTDSPQGPGWFIGDGEMEFYRHGYDTELTALYEEKEVMARLQNLWDNKAYGIDFFRRKILSQWNAPAYHGYYETKSFICEPEDLPKIVHRIYFEDETVINAFMNRYQSVLYFNLSAGVLFALVKKEKQRYLEDRILLIAIIGGFLFHVLWEAMSRYALPYAIYMIPMAAIGMGQIREILDSVVSRFSSMAACRSGNDTFV